MHKSASVFVVLVLMAALSGLLSGCGLLDYYFLPPPEETAQELYEAGMDAMAEQDYSSAQDYFTKLKDRYPFSPFTVDAELALGDSYFLDGEYLLAADAYKEFDALHPAHPQTPYVLFQIGMSNFNQFRTIDLRQSNVMDGLEYFYRVKDQYPDSPYAASAEEYIAKSRRILAEHELYVADFFWRTEKYGAAWKRYTYVVENFPDVPELHEYAKKRAEYSYYEYQKDESRQEQEETYGTWKDYFEWL